MISRDATLAAALDIIDREGLEALSMRRLGRALGVSGASLYHHFENKDAIISAVAVMALQSRGDGALVDPTEHWASWLPFQARKLRDTMVEHPSLIPVFIVNQHVNQHLPVAGRVLEIWIARILQSGTSVDAVMPILDALRYWAIASALHETQGEGAERDPQFKEQFPLLAMVRERRGALSDDIFETVCHAIADAIVAHGRDSADHQRRAEEPPKSKRKTREATAGSLNGRALSGHRANVAKVG